MKKEEKMDKKELIEMGVDGEPEKINNLLIVAGFGTILILVVIVIVARAIFGAP